MYECTCMYVCMYVCAFTEIYHPIQISLFPHPNKQFNIWDNRFWQVGELAQMVERSLSMREVPGSMPGFSSGRLFLIFISRLFNTNEWIIYLSIGTSTEHHFQIDKKKKKKTKRKKCRSGKILKRMKFNFSSKINLNNKNIIKLN